MNKIMLIGNVGKDPEVKYVEQGVAVARLSLATTERGYALPNGTQVPDRTDWHNVILWRRLAEVVEKYVHKGDKLYNCDTDFRYKLYVCFIRVTYPLRYVFVMLLRPCLVRIKRFFNQKRKDK